MHGEQTLSESETLIKNNEIQVESSAFKKNFSANMCKVGLSNRRL